MQKIPIIVISERRNPLAHPNIYGDGPGVGVGFAYTKKKI